MHTHTWTYRPDHADHACTDCDVTCPACRLCRTKPGIPTGTDLNLCRPCHNHYGRLLEEAETAIDALSDTMLELSGLRATRYDLTRTTTATSPLPFGLDQKFDDHAGGKPHTAPGAIDDLNTVAEEWEEKGATDCTSWRHLRAHIVWAVQTLDQDTIDTTFEIIRTATGLVRRMAGFGSLRTDATCLDCGGWLVNDWTEQGLTDEARCQTCRRVYTAGSHRLAQLARIQEAPDKKPDALVTEKEALRVFPQLVEGTVRKWVQRGQLERRGVNRNGDALYRVGDIAARHQRSVEKVG